MTTIDDIKTTPHFRSLLAREPALRGLANRMIEFCEREAPGCSFSVTDPWDPERCKTCHPFIEANFAAELPQGYEYKVALDLEEKFINERLDLLGESGTWKADSMLTLDIGCALDENEEAK